MQGGSPMQMAQRGAYADPGNQLGAVYGAYGLQFNPFFRGGFSNVLQDEFDRQQAVDPSTSFLNYAKQRGFF